MEITQETHGQHWSPKQAIAIIIIKSVLSGQIQISV